MRKSVFEDVAGPLGFDSPDTNLSTTTPMPKLEIANLRNCRQAMRRLACCGLLFGGFKSQTFLRMRLRS
jgi:hypothetical protein